VSEIVAVKVPKKLRSAMRRLSGRVNWPAEIRAFIWERVRQEEAEENIKKVTELIEKTSSASSGFAAASVREDRDSG